MMIRALRPGGWLVLEDADPGLQPLLCPDEHGDAEKLGNRLRHGFRNLMAQHGADLAFGRALPRLLPNAGLLDVDAYAYFPGTSPDCTALEAATARQIRGRLVAAGLATDAEIDQHLTNVAHWPMDLATPADLRVGPQAGNLTRRPARTGHRNNHDLRF